MALKLDWYAYDVRTLRAWLKEALQDESFEITFTVFSKEIHWQVSRLDEDKWMLTTANVNKVVSTNFVCAYIRMITARIAEDCLDEVCDELLNKSV